MSGTLLATVISTAKSFHHAVLSIRIVPTNKKQTIYLVFLLRCVKFAESRPKSHNSLCVKFQDYINLESMANKNLNKAKVAKKDEFYTQLEDINNELRHYREHFRGKTVLCNCDDPRVSNSLTLPIILNFLV